MNVWVVVQSWPTFDLVDDNLEIHYADVGEIVGVFSSEEKARAVQEKLIGLNADEMVTVDADPIDVVVACWEVQ